MERQGDPGAAAAFLAAFEAGLPLFRDGVGLLLSAVERLRLQHPRVPALRALAACPSADPLWSATMVQAE
jgi:hypothetical protein